MPGIAPGAQGGGKLTEFGPKINASGTKGFARADRIDLNAFPEAEDLIGQIQGYRTRFGYYPGRVVTDQVYCTQRNRKWLRERNKDIGGVPLGQKTKYQKEKERRKNNQRSEVEGKFGEVKERYGRDRLYTRLPRTTVAEISLITLSVNLVKLLLEVGDSFK